MRVRSYLPDPAAFAGLAAGAFAIGLTAGGVAAWHGRDAVDPTATKKPVSVLAQRDAAPLETAPSSRAEPALAPAIMIAPTPPEPITILAPPAPAGLSDASSVSEPRRRVASAPEAAPLQQTAAEPRLLAAADAPAKQETMRARSGDTLAGLLADAGASHTDARMAVAAIAERWDPRDLRPGMVVEADWVQGDGGDLARVSLRATPFRLVVAERGADDLFAARFEEAPSEQRTLRAEGEIEGSLFRSAARVDLSRAATEAFVRILSYDVDFSRDIQRGDSFELIVDHEVALDEDATRNERLRFARLNLTEREILAYAFERDGRTAYFDAQGRSIRTSLLATPIDGARVSSGFGPRRHPILGRWRDHKGVDFAAPTGTPIYASGDGVVERIGPNGGYGNYIRVRHNGEFKTAYAHLSRFAEGLAKGDRVEQGDIIGYVGSTGRSTGPHLHYEVIRHGEQIDPKKVPRDVAEQLEGAELAAFEKVRDDIDRLRRRLGNGVAVASAEGI